MSIEDIKKLKEEVKSAEELLVSKRKEIIKSKLAYLQDNPDTEEAYLTIEEWLILKEYLIERSDATSVKMQHTQIIDYDGYNENYYNTILRVGGKYISIYDSAVWGEKNYLFSVKDTLSADYKEYFDEYYKKDIKEVTLNGIVFKKDGDTRPIIEGKNELTKPLDIEKLFEEKTTILDNPIKNEDINYEKSENQLLTEQEKSIIEKLKIIEKTNNKEISKDMFEYTEIRRIREIYEDKATHFTMDSYIFDWTDESYNKAEIVLFRIGDKIVEHYSDAMEENLSIYTQEDYQKMLENQEKDLQIPQRKITIEEIEEAFSKDNKIRNTTEEFRQFVKDSVPKVFGEKRPMVVCNDGREYSIQASSAHYCLTKKDGLEAYEEFEVWFGEDVEEPDLEEYSTHDGIYANVPESVIVEMLVKHGGLNKELMQQRLQEQKARYKEDDMLDDAILKMFDGNRAMAELFKLATRKSDLSKKNEQAKDLLNEYEKQEGKDGQEQGDEE